MRIALLACATLAACSQGNSGGDLGSGDLGGDLSTTDATLAVDAAVAPLVVPTNTWAWFDIPGSVCDDGTQTGIGISSGDSDKLLVFFEGGGACGDYITCYQLNTAVHGPFGATEFQARIALRGGSILDRAAPGSPFGAYTIVYVPYCTGDVHAGDRTQMYTGQGQTLTYHHAGHTNALNALASLAATWPTLTKLVVSGSSAGGFGSAINYDSYRARWPSAQGYLLDDSGPILESAVTPQSLKTWYLSWGVLDWVMPVCPECVSETAKIYPKLGALFPDDRLALFSSLQDGTISAFYGFTGNAAGFQAALLKLAMDYIDPNPKFHRFFVSGTTHTMLGDPPGFTSNGVALWAWITQMITDDAAWATQAP